MAKQSIKPNDLVLITFWDHAENASDALKFEVVGRVFGVTQRAYKVRSWGYVSDVDRAADSSHHNENWFVIVKRDIESIKVLK